MLAVALAATASAACSRGQDSVDPSSSAGPTTRNAPSGWTATRSEKGLTPPEVTDKKTFAMYSPHLDLTITSGTTNQLKHDEARKLGYGTDASSAPLTAPDGEEFLVIHVRAKANWPWREGWPVPTLTLITDAGHLVSATWGVPDDDDYGKLGTLLVASLPIGGEAVLRLNDASKMAQADARTGELGNDSNTAMMVASVRQVGRLSWKEETAHWLGSWRDSSNSDTLALELTWKESYYTNFIPDLGWAPEGKRWLTLNFDPKFTSRWNTKLSFQASERCVVTNEDGPGYFYARAAVIKLEDWRYAERGTLHFLADEGLDACTFTLTMPTTYTVQYATGTVTDVPITSDGPLRAPFTIT